MGQDTNTRQIALSAIILALIGSVPVILRPLLFLADDAFFYPQVAYKIVTTGHSTFNGVTPTNGYHPLWVIVNVLVMASVHASKLHGLLLLLGVEACIVAFSIWLYSRLMRIIRIRYSWLGVGLMVAVCASSFWGMESHITQAALLLASIQFVKCRRSEKAGVYILLGLLLGLTTLARLDDCFFAAALALGVIAGRPVKHGLYALSLTSVSFLCTMLPYLLLEKKYFGHIVPVSGVIKSSFPHLNFSLSNVGSLGTTCAIVAICGLTYSIVSNRQSDTSSLIAALSMGNIMQAAYTALFTRDNSTRSFWYYASAVIVTCIIADIALDAALRHVSIHQRQVHLQGAALVVAFAIMCLGVARSWLKMFDIDINPLFSLHLLRSTDVNGVRFEQKLAEYIQDDLPNGAGVAVVDFPGRLAFLTDARIVPLDGLIADYGYNNQLINEGVGRYFQEHNVQYYMGPICHPGESCSYSYFIKGQAGSQWQRVEVLSPLYRESAGVLTFTRKDLLLDINQAFGTTLLHGHLGLWHIDTLQAQK